MQLKGKRIVRLMFLVVVPLLFVYLLFKVRRILIPLGFAILIAFVLNPFVNLIEKRKVPRGIAILIVYLSVFVIVTGLITIGIPIIMDELTSFGRAIPRITSEVQGIVNDAQARYSRFALPEPIKEVFDERIKHLEVQLVKLVGGLAEGVVGIFTHIFSLLIAPIFAFYLLADAGHFRKGFMSLVPAHWRNDLKSLTVEINEIFSKYIRGHLLVSTIVGMLTAIGFAVIGLDYAVMLGIFAGLADLIPYFGPIIGGAPALMLGLLDSKAMALKVVAVVLIIQQLENAVISPKIIGDRLGLSPLAVILGLMAGGELYGIVGLLLGVPAIAVTKCLLNFIYLKLVDQN